MERGAIVEVIRESGAGLVASTGDVLDAEELNELLQSVAFITRWLSDIPRETPAARALPRSENRPAPGAPETRQVLAAVWPAPDSRPATERPPPTLRAWLAMGRDLGRSAVSRYVQKVRTVVGRTEE